jgi:hypothetical protein
VVVVVAMVMVVMVVMVVMWGHWGHWGHLFLDGHFGLSTVTLLLNACNTL